MIYQEAMGITGVTLPPDPIQQQPTYDGALAAFEKLPPIRVLFDNGAGGAAARPAAARASSSRSSSFPVPGTKARSWYLAPGGALGDAPPAQAGADAFTLERARAAADRLHRRHRGGHGRPVDRDAAVQVDAEPGGQRRRPT